METNTPKTPETISSEERVEILRQVIEKFGTGELIGIRDGDNIGFSIEEAETEETASIQLFFNAPNVDPTSDDSFNFTYTYLVNLPTGEIVSKTAEIHYDAIPRKEESETQSNDIDKEIRAMLTRAGQTTQERISTISEEKIEKDFPGEAGSGRDFLNKFAAHFRKIKISDTTRADVRNRLREIVDTLDLATLRALNPRKSMTIETPDIPSWAQDDPRIPDLEDDNTPFVLLKKALESK